MNSSDDRVQLDQKAINDWNTPVPRDVFMEHFAAEFAALGLTPGQVSALITIGVLMSVGGLDEYIKVIAAALEGPQGDECQR